MNREFKKRPRQRQREHHLKIISRLFKVIMQATYILIMLECEIASGDSEIKKKRNQHCRETVALTHTLQNTYKSF